MPNRWPIQNGNWSNPATWSGSLIPTASDDVFANNFTVNVDTSFQVLSLRNTASGSAIAVSGSFNFNSGSISGSATSITPLVAGATNLITVTAATGEVALTLNGSFAPTATTNFFIVHSGNCNFTITGTNLIANQTSLGPFMSKTSAGTITFNANLIGGGNVVAFTSNNGNTVINGNVTPGVGTFGVTGISQTAGSLTINGNITGGNNDPISIGVSFSGTSMTVNGNVIGGKATAISVTSAAPINISGSVVATSGTPAISLTGASQLTIIGNVSASAASPAVSSTNANSRVNLTGNMLNVNGKMAIYAPALFISNTTPTTANFSITGGNSKAFYSEDVPSNVPSASNVRSGVSYRDGAALVGTVIIPSSTDVRSGVTYDANNSVTGSAIITTNLLLNEISSSSSPVAVRIRNAATPEIFGELMEAFKK